MALFDQVPVPQIQSVGVRPGVTSVDTSQLNQAIANLEPRPGRQRNIEAEAAAINQNTADIAVGRILGETLETSLEGMGTRTINPSSPEAAVTSDSDPSLPDAAPADQAAANSISQTLTGLANKQVASGVPQRVQAAYRLQQFINANPHLTGPALKSFKAAFGDTPFKVMQQAFDATAAAAQADQKARVEWATKLVQGAEQWDLRMEQDEELLLTTALQIQADNADLKRRTQVLQDAQNNAELNKVQRVEIQQNNLEAFQVSTQRYVVTSISRSLALLHFDDKGNPLKSVFDRDPEQLNAFIGQLNDVLSQQIATVDTLFGDLTESQKESMIAPVRQQVQAALDYLDPKKHANMSKNIRLLEDQKVLSKLDATSRTKLLERSGFVNYGAVAQMFDEGATKQVEGAYKNFAEAQRGINGVGGASRNATRLPTVQGVALTVLVNPTTKKEQLVAVFPRLDAAAEQDGADPSVVTRQFVNGLGVGATNKDDTPESRAAYQLALANLGKEIASYSPAKINEYTAMAAENLPDEQLLRMEELIKVSAQHPDVLKDLSSAIDYQEEQGADRDNMIKVVHMYQTQMSSYINNKLSKTVPPTADGTPAVVVEVGGDGVARFIPNPEYLAADVANDIPLPGFIASRLSPESTRMNPKVAEQRKQARNKAVTDAAAELNRSIAPRLTNSIKAAAHLTGTKDYTSASDVLGNVVRDTGVTFRMASDPTRDALNQELLQDEPAELDEQAQQEADLKRIQSIPREQYTAGLKAAGDLGLVDESTLRAIGFIESSGGTKLIPTDRKTGRVLSSARGPFQFIDKTWMEAIERDAKTAGVDVSGLSKEEILDLRYDPEVSAKIAAAYHARYAKAAGYDPKDPANAHLVYLTHFAGPGVAKMVAQGKEIPAATRASYAKANPSIFKTAEDVTPQNLAKFAKTKINNAQAQVAKLVAGDAARVQKL